MIKAREGELVKPKLTNRRNGRNISKKTKRKCGRSVNRSITKYIMIWDIVKFIAIYSFKISIFYDFYEHVIKDIDRQSRVLNTKRKQMLQLIKWRMYCSLDNQWETENINLHSTGKLAKQYTCKYVNQRHRMSYINTWGLEYLSSIRHSHR